MTRDRVRGGGKGKDYGQAKGGIKMGSTPLGLEAGDSLAAIRCVVCGHGDVP